MEFFLDSANMAEIEEALKLGIIDGVTTTPTFMHKNGITDIDGAIVKLSKMVPVLMIEALGENSQEIVAEAKRLLALGLDLPETLRARLLAYIALIEKWNRTYNLTSIRDAGEMVSLHLLDSLSVLPFLPESALAGRRWADGLHQAVEAKEGIKIERENQTLATITFQNYFRMYRKLSGMTGTAYTEANEFKQIYDLDVIVIPTNRPIRRVDFNDIQPRVQFKTKTKPAIPD